MQRKKPVKEVYVKNKLTLKMQKKLVVLVCVVLLAFLALSLRLYSIVRDKGESYKKQILAQQEYGSTTIPYKRGNITDCNGTMLATSEKVYNVIVDSKMITNTEGALEPTLEAIYSCFGADKARVREYIAAHPQSQYYIAVKKTNYEAKAAFEDLAAEDSNIKGIWFEEEYQRVYPNGKLACDVIGFTTSDGVGMYGLEQFYNDQLSGENGREYGYLNEDATFERTTVAATDGYTLVSTIDANIQSIVERKLRDYNDTYQNAYREGLGAQNVGCIVMNPNNGEIYAMASFPNFDLNNPYDLSGIYSEEALELMTDEEIATARNELWKNFCITDTYEPGSTAKPFTVATGLESGVLTGNESYFCEGYLSIGGFQIHCHNRYGHGTISVKEAMETSCNVSLMYMGFAIGKNDMLKYERMFNFGLKTNIDLAGEARTDALVFTDKTMNETELATASFGQGFNVTMIQLANAYCSLINGGYYYEPHMVSKVLNADGAVVETIEPRMLKQVISRETSDKIIEYCNAVVTDGTGTTARPAGYSIGGKTGTAEVVPRGNGNYVVSFISYAPADDPQVVVYVVVDRPNQKKQDNARLATIIVREVLTEVLPYLGIPMTEELSEAEIQELKERQIAFTQPDPEEEEGTEEGEEGVTTGEEGEEPQEEEPREIYPNIDPETGYAIDPLTGEYLDPETGEPIDPNSSLFVPIEE